MSEKTGEETKELVILIPWICEGCEYRVSTIKWTLLPCIYCRRPTRPASKEEFEEGGFDDIREWPL
jgi:hypothetical protein